MFSLREKFGAKNALCAKIVVKYQITLSNKNKNEQSVYFLFHTKQFRRKLF